MSSSQAIMTNNGKKTIGPYEIGKKIGEGTFGKVKLGRNIFTNEKVAIKIVDYKRIRTAAERRLIEREKKVLSLLDHPNIVKLHKLLDDPEGGHCYIVIEYVSGGELFDYIVAHGRLREKDARRFLRQIISAVEYCHAHLIVHRDLKPENLLLDGDMNIKITDFGLANIMSPGSKFKTFCGSLHYACPEILRGEEYIGPGADIWAMGIILYCLVTGSQPWSAMTSEDILHQILVDGLHIPVWLTPDCMDLIVKMLRLKEKDRITLNEMKRHPWIMKGYDEQPISYLPVYKCIDRIDEHVMKQMVQLGFLDGRQERNQILGGENAPIVATYHLLLRRHQEQLKFNHQGRDGSQYDLVNKTADEVYNINITGDEPKDYFVNDRRPSSIENVTWSSDRRPFIPGSCCDKGEGLTPDWLDPSIESDSSRITSQNITDQCKSIEDGGGSSSVIANTENTGTNFLFISNYHGHGNRESSINQESDHHRRGFGPNTVNLIKPKSTSPLTRLKFPKIRFPSLRIGGGSSHESKNSKKMANKRDQELTLACLARNDGLNASSCPIDYIPATPLPGHIPKKPTVKIDEIEKQCQEQSCGKRHKVKTNIGSSRRGHGNEKKSVYDIFPSHDCSNMPSTRDDGYRTIWMCNNFLVTPSTK